jgi:hypothetical protein
MIKLSWLSRVLDALSDGRIVRRATAAFLRTMAVGTIVMGVLGGFMTLAVTFRLGSLTGVSIGVFAGGLVYSVLLVTLCGVLAELSRYRARTIDALPSSPFTVIPVISVLLRLSGELFAALCLGFGVGAVVLLAFGAEQVGRQGLFRLPELVPGYSSSVFTGVVDLAFTVVVAFGGILCAYFLAESALVLAQIAINTGVLVERTTSMSEGVTLMTAGPAEAPDDSRLSPQAPFSPSVPTGLRCSSCGARLEPDAAFCENCGAAADRAGAY